MSAQVRQRILLVSVGLELAGPARFVVNLAKHLDPTRWEVHLAVIRGGPLRDDLDESEVRLLVTSPHMTEQTNRVRLATGPFFRISSYIAATRPAIVHTHLFGLDLIGRTAALLHHVPVILSTQHDINPRPRYQNAYRRITSRMIEGTVACSDSVAGYCRSVMHVPEDRLFTIDNGVDVSRFVDARRPSQTVHHFLALGSISAPKGHSDLIEAFALLHEHEPDTRLTISGEGPLEPMVRQLIAKHGLEDAVCIQSPSPDIVGLLRGTDALVQPSVREGLPQAVLEAMAAAKPIVATRIPAHVSVLDNGGCGLLAPPSDPRGLAEAMLTFVENPDLGRRLGRSALARVSEHYSLEKMVDSYSSLYESLVARAS